MALNPASPARLLGFEQTTSAAGNTATTSVTYQYNSAGDLLGDGLATYRYDSEGRMESARTGEGEDPPPPNTPTTPWASACPRRRRSTVASAVS